MTDDTDDIRLISANIGTLFPGDAGKPIDDVDRPRFQTAADWQQLGSLAQFAEMRGVLAGMRMGYMAEMLGRAAAAGEQLGLALTAVRDAEVWVETQTPPAQSSRRILAGRALAETSGMWSVSTGHAAVNVVARVLRAHHDATYLDKAFGWFGPPEPFAEVRGSNLSINRPTVKALGRAAKETRDARLERLVAPLSDLLKDPDWAAVAARRDLGYHRWRPQSIAGGASTRNPWGDEGGTSSMAVGETSGHIPPALGSVVLETRNGYNKLSDAMRAVFEAMPAAMVAAGIEIWKTDDIVSSTEAD
ncbi:hypothetical protein [Curtobacterium flaccumfaciens]|uniref:hypothetical protein n=1 Tax=Curtobacterium flaccumfaciens TaxID=2035 RepID=UPI0039920AD2